MSIQDEAARGIDRLRAGGKGSYLTALELAAAGILAPELPDHIETSPDNMPDIYTNGGHVYAVLNNGYDSDWERLNPSEATEFALRLLAAAKYAEEEK